MTWTTDIGPQPIVKIGAFLLGFFDGASAFLGYHFFRYSDRTKESIRDRHHSGQCSDCHGEIEKTHVDFGDRKELS